MTTEHVKKVRQQLNEEFPGFKFSVRNRNHSTIEISILSGPFDFSVLRGHKDVNQWDFLKGTKVNHHFIDRHFGKDFPAFARFFNRVKEIANEGNGIEVVDGDYGPVPDFYLNIEIGRYEKEYEHTPDTQIPNERYARFIQLEPNFPYSRIELVEKDEFMDEESVRTVAYVNKIDDYYVVSDAAMKRPYKVCVGLFELTQFIDQVIIKDEEGVY